MVLAIPKNKLTHLGQPIPPQKKPTVSEQYEEIIFNSPKEEFHKILTETKITPMALRGSRYSEHCNYYFKMLKLTAQGLNSTKMKSLERFKKFKSVLNWKFKNYETNANKWKLRFKVLALAAVQFRCLPLHLHHKA
jgi:hypothetical protein